MRKWTLAFLTVLLFLTLAVPAWADDGDDQVVFFGERVVIESGEEVDGNLTVIGGSLELQEGGRIRGDVVALGGDSIVDGQINGNLVVVGGTLDLRSHATVEQDLYTLGASVSRAAGATVVGETVEGLRWRLPAWRGRPSIRLPWDIGQRWRSPDLFFADLFGYSIRWVARTIVWIAIGVLIILLLPKQTALVGQTGSQLPLPSAGVGLLTLVVLLIVMPLLVIICIGIPVAVLLVIALLAALLLGRVAIGAIVGQRLLSALKARQSQPLLEVVIGIVLIELLSAVPCLGWLLGWTVSLVGLGAVVLTRFGTMPYGSLSGRSELPAPSPEPEAPRAPEDKAQD